MSWRHHASTFKKPDIYYIRKKGGRSDSTERLDLLVPQAVRLALQIDLILSGLWWIRRRALGVSIQECCWVWSPIPYQLLNVDCWWIWHPHVDCRAPDCIDQQGLPWSNIPDGKGWSSRKFTHHVLFLKNRSLQHCLTFWMLLMQSWDYRELCVLLNMTSLQHKQSYSHT